MNRWNERFSQYWINQIDNSRLLTTLNEQLQEDWNNASLNTIDAFLMKNCKIISCAEVAAMYFKFWLDLKNIKANSTNFVGFSEFLILRCFLHLLNKDYFASNTLSCKPQTRDRGYFSFGDGKVIVTTEYLPKEFWSEGKRRPDIVLYKQEPLKFLGIIQTKAFPPSSKYVIKELDFFEKLKMKNSNQGSPKCVVIMFSPAFKKVKSEMAVSLWNNNTLISNLFKNNLDLDRLKQI